MAIEFGCPACHNTLRVADDAAGRAVRCGSCLATLRAPTPPADPPAPPPPHEPAAPPTRADPVGPPPDDDRPRPRRRRRRPPPKPAGRGPAFWVLIGLLAVGLLTVAACGGAIALLGPKWRPHQSAAGGFAVELPAEPQPDVADLLLARAGPGARAEGAMLVGRLEVYGVIYTDLDPAARLTPPEVLLDQAVRAVEDDNPGTRVVRNDPATVSGFPAREIAYTGEDDSTFLCRIVLAGPRLFILSAGGPRAGPEGNPRIRRFLDSFRVTDPNLLAEKNRPAAGDPLAAMRERLEAVRKAADRRREELQRGNGLRIPDPDDEEPADPPPVAPPPRPAAPRDD